ncbi:hypothetical protein AB1N83_013527 [Pleurotus pulmonarius]
MLSSLTGLPCPSIFSTVSKQKESQRRRPHHGEHCNVSAFESCRTRRAFSVPRTYKTPYFEPILLHPPHHFPFKAIRPLFQPSSGSQIDKDTTYRRHFVGRILPPSKGL